MKKFFSVLPLLLLTAASGYAQTPLEISGSYKNLAISSQAQASDESIYAVTQRLRLNFQKNMDPWQFYLSLDNEAVISDFANHPEFDVVRSLSQDRNANIDLDKVSVDNDHLYLRHAVYRAYVKYYTEEFQATAGKQAIDWGRLRFFSPLDIFNPVGALDLERDQRIGIDAIDLNFSPKDFAGINLVVAPGESDEKSSFAAKIYKTLATYDLTLMVANIQKDEIVGFAFDGYVKGAGFRGEITHTRNDETGRSFPRIGIGVDYRFSDKFYALFEQFYNGGNEDNDPSALSTYRGISRVLSVKKNLSNLWLNYTITPLLDFNNYLIYDWDGNSVVWNPEFKYNITKNTDLVIGTQFFWGNADSEFGNREHLFYIEVKWFF